MYIASSHTRGGDTAKHTTGQTNRRDAEVWVEKKLAALKADEERRKMPTLKQYADPFYVWGKCPYLRQLFTDGDKVTMRYVDSQHGIIDNHIFKDPVSDLKLFDITKKDIEEFKARRKQHFTEALESSPHSGREAINKALGILKRIFR